MAAVTIDPTAVRARFSSLAGGFAFLDAPGGSQVPDAVGDAIARCAARGEREHGRDLRDEPAGRRDRRRGRGEGRGVPGLRAQRDHLRAEHDLARLHAVAHGGTRVRGRRRDPRLLARPRRRRRSVARAGARQGPARPAHRAARRHDARLRRPRRQADRAHARRRVRLGVECDRHDRRRGARLRARAQRRRAGLGRRRPLRGARADRRRRDRRRRAALLALQVLRPPPRHRLRAHVAARVLAPVQGAPGADDARSAAASRPARSPTSCSPASTRRSTTWRRSAAWRRSCPTSAASASASSRRCPTASPSTGCRRSRAACRPSSSTSPARPPPRSRRTLAERGIGVWAHNTWYSLNLYQRLGYDGDAIRIGFIHYNTAEEVDRLVSELAACGPS